MCHFAVEVNAVRGGFLEGALENVNIYRSWPLGILRESDFY